METRESVVFQPLPGSDALKSAPYFNPHRPLPFRSMRRHIQEGAHRTYLDNPTYNQYLQLDKMLVDEAGVADLQAIGTVLEKEEMPVYLDAAGWAFAEAGIVSESLTTVDRVESISHAESIWARGLVNGMAMGDHFGDRQQYEENEGHRLALNLAFAPLMKSIAIGNVREEALQHTLRDVAEIANDSRASLERAEARGDEVTARYHKGFLFEASALMALLYIGDPRYVPMPASARADSGYYNAKQTHDISVFNQHWGEIRKVIPVEVKSMASRRARKRYRALIVSGRLRLSVGDTTESSETAEAFHSMVHGTASTEQIAGIEQLSTQLREMLRLYQRGVSAEGVAIGGLTRFYDSKEAAQVYPELARDYRWSPDAQPL